MATDTVKCPSELKTAAGFGYSCFYEEISDTAWREAGLSSLTVSEFVFNACKAELKRRRDEFTQQQKTTAATAV